MTLSKSQLYQKVEKQCVCVCGGGGYAVKLDTLLARTRYLKATNRSALDSLSLAAVVSASSLAVPWVKKSVSWLSCAKKCYNDWW